MAGLPAGCKARGACAAGRAVYNDLPRPKEWSAEVSAVAIVAGIDEAGFGPVLGPLVVSACVFHLPDELAEADLWKVLAGAVSKRMTKRHRGLIIGDSKKLYSPSLGLTYLERGVLGALGCADQRPESLRALLAWLSPELAGEVDAYPWYRQADLPLPVANEAVDLRLRTNGLRSVMERKGVRLVGVRSEVLLAGRYNRLVAATDNKATTLVDQSLRLMDWAWRGRGEQKHVRVYVDRQGGRAHYVPVLQRCYPQARLQVLVEGPGHSAYRLDMDAATLEVHFRQDGEGWQLPTALASMTSKYVRELKMMLLNRFWAERVAGLKPTAGYHPDGLRFLHDIEAARTQLQVPLELLARSR